MKHIQNTMEGFPFCSFIFLWGWVEKERQSKKGLFARADHQLGTNVGLGCISSFLPLLASTPQFIK